MKKYLILFASLSLIVFMVFLFGGCTFSSANENNISDLRQGIYDGQCEEYNATFVYGTRENPYLADGVANKMVEFGIISVIFETKPTENETTEFLLEIDGKKTVSGTLEKSPYTNEYMADIGATVPDGSTLKLIVKLNGEEISVPLTNQNTSWQINSSKAYEIGKNALKNEIAEIKNNNQSYELHIKITTQQETNFGKYYWQVTVISSSGKKHNVLFSPQSEEILLKN